MKLRSCIMFSLPSFSARINVSLLFASICVIPESPWPYRAEDVWFSSKLPAFYNQFTQEEMPFQQHLCRFKGLIAGERKSFLVHVLQFYMRSYLFSQASFIWTISDFWPCSGCVASDYETRCDSSSMTAGHRCRDFYKTKMTDMLSNHRGWQREKCLFWSFNGCENLSVIFIWKWRSKGNKVQNVNLVGFWGFWD